MLELLNRYCNGLTVVPVVRALEEQGGLSYLRRAQKFSLRQMASALKANTGYLRTALRMFACLDWIRPIDDDSYVVTGELDHAHIIPADIMTLYRFPFDEYVAGGSAASLEEWLNRSERRWNSDHVFWPDYLDGLIIVPLLLAVQKRGGLSALEGTARLEVERLFLFKEWAQRLDAGLSLNRAGQFMLDRILVTAVLASYRPMLRQFDRLVFGDPRQVFALDSAGRETHLDRTLNVSGSGFQHEKYFAALAESVMALFDNESYETQPRYIADTGSGDGSLLRYLYEKVQHHTRRGRALDRYPLRLIAIDYNEEALASATHTLANLDAVAVQGDVGDPAGIVCSLRERGIDPSQVLHVRSFLDHDRRYLTPLDREAVQARAGLRYHGVYIDADGELIPPADMVQSTVEHLRRWAEVLNDFGLIVLEVHCLPEQVTKQHLDESESFFFDACQSMSHQHLLEADTFLNCATEAGLVGEPSRRQRFPKHMPFTRISLNHFRKRAVQEHAEVDPRRAERELGDFAFRWAHAVLQSMGVMREQGEEYALEELVLRLGVAPKHRRYFAALLNRMAHRGLLSMVNQGVRTSAAIQDHALKDIATEVAEFTASFGKRHPGCAGLMNFTSGCLRQYKEILTGQIDAIAVVFADGDMGAFGAVFHEDATAQYFNRAMADAVVGAIEKSADRPVRILEIGAGSGGTTAAVLTAIGPSRRNTTYCFTDISQAFLRHGRRRFEAQFSGIEFRILNIEADLAGQGFEPASFDVIVAANVLHDTRDIDFTLKQTRALLKPDGLLVLDEFTELKDCLLFSGALLHGAWLFEDAERRLEDFCLLSVRQWKSALNRTGFRVIEHITLPAQQHQDDCSQSVLLCKPIPLAVSDEPETLIGQKVEALILTILGSARQGAYDPTRPLMQLGLDSLELVELKSMINAEFFIKLSPVFLFQHETQRKIAQALVALVPQDTLCRASGPPKSHPDVPAVDKSAIAIVGAACRLPGGASSPSAFWKLLEEGRDGIVTLPNGRWQWPDLIDAADQHKGIDRGGFLERIDEFDALFFHISPKEARLMDPQQRLLLELSWEAFEDAGHRSSELCGRDVGVFIGACHSDYRDVLITSADASDSYVGSGSALSMLANRVSYFFDFTGPSASIDTACSSALVALHQAVESIRKGDCTQALVGAVNLLCSPTNSVAYYQAGMLSPGGACKTFDHRADGYVRGEGGVVILLKPLAMALEDRDAIYGVIKGSAVNHGGQASTLTAPKPQAQAALIEQALVSANIAPDSLRYVEAHGTGTKLGDPIEAAGLVSAFLSAHQRTKRPLPSKAYCALGSVKSNIGHLEGAAGLAGLLKVLLAMERGVIPQTLNYQQLNPHIDLAGTPFYIAQRNEPWERLPESPRRAGVSSFGFGGANAHVIVEEFPRAGSRTPAHNRPHLIPLSAHAPEHLKASAVKLLQFLEQESAEAPDSLLTTLQAILQRVFGLAEDELRALSWRDLDWGVTETALFIEAVDEACGVRLHSRSLMEHRTLDSLVASLAGTSGPHPAMTLENLAYTLQVGREPMEARVAFVVENLPELIHALRGFIAGEQRRHPESSDLTEQAAAWARGAEVNWSALHPTGTRIHLPTYPFERKRYWVSPATDVRAAAHLHPLLHQNVSDLHRVRFSSELTGQEFFLAAHRVHGEKVLPAAAHLEMIRAAFERADDESGVRPTALCLRNIVWSRPAIVNDTPLRLIVELRATDAGAVECEIYQAAERRVTFSQGEALRIDMPGEPVTIDLVALRSRCETPPLSGAECYRAFAEMGLNYGAAHQGLVQVLRGTSTDGTRFVLAQLALPQSIDATESQYGMHPSLLDSALQASLALTSEWRLRLPFALRKLVVLSRCPPTAFAYVRLSADGNLEDRDRELDIDVCDESGRVSLSLQGLLMRSAEREQASDRYFAPAWAVHEVNGAAPGMMPPGSVLLIGGTTRERCLVQRHFSQADLVESLESARRAQIAHVVWIVPKSARPSLTDESLLTEQNDGAHLGFRLVKALLNQGYDSKPLAWTVVTTQAQAVTSGESVSPTHAGIHGLMGVIAKEYPEWRVRVVDMPADEEPPWSSIFALPYDAQGNCVAYRDDSWFTQQLIPYRPTFVPVSIFNPGAVIVVVGGAGGIAQALSEEISRCTSVQWVWLGRRAADARIQAAMDRLAAQGPAPLYISCDAADRSQLEAARAEIKQRFGKIDGLIHAAMQVRDRSLAQMTADDFRAGFESKVDVCVRMAQVFANDPLQFVMFFSSISSFAKPPGQANYAAGCAFKDAFALQLAKAWPCTVRVINWGFWGSVGAATAERFQEKMARAGLASIETPDALGALGDLLAGPRTQTIFLKATHHLALRGVTIESVPAPRQANEAAPRISGALLMSQAKERAIEALLDHLLSRVCEISAADPLDLRSRSRRFSDTRLGEFGMDSLQSTDLRSALRRDLSIDIPVQTLISEKAGTIVQLLYEQLLLQQLTTRRAEEVEDMETIVL